MLHISFPDIKKKGHSIVAAGSISLPVGKGVVLHGEEKSISALFTQLMYKTCTWTLDNELVDTSYHSLILLKSA